MAVTSFSKSSIQDFARTNDMDTASAPRAIVSAVTGAPNSATTGVAYVFKGSGSITVSKAGYLDLLIVSGGGGGGLGGGGGGGILSASRFFEKGTYTVTIGAGGAAGFTDTTSGGSGYRMGFNGGESSIGIYFAPGGGGGGNGAGSQVNQGCKGGSGGGGGTTNYGVGANTFGLATPGFGNNGGAGGFLTGGGGGGGGAVGENGGARYPNGSWGGNGATTTIISTTDATSFSVGQVSGGLLYFAGGGAGVKYEGTNGTGGLGGGGNGGGGGVAGVANTGGGGGGASTTGGSGCLIVRVR